MLPDVVCMSILAREPDRLIYMPCELPEDIVLARASPRRREGKERDQSRGIEDHRDSMQGSSYRRDKELKRGDR